MKCFSLFDFQSSLVVGRIEFDKTAVEPRLTASYLNKLVKMLEPQFTISNLIRREFGTITAGRRDESCRVKRVVYLTK